jgi:hypothetical protein
MTEKVCPHCGRKLPGDKEPKYYIANNGKIIKAFSISHIWQNCERCEMAAGPYHLFVIFVCALRAIS